MTSSENSRRTVFGPRAGHLHPVRYRIPAGLAEEVLREAQRRNVSASTVVAAILAQGLASFAAAGVADRLEHAIRASVESTPTAPPAATLAVSHDNHSTPTATYPLEYRHV